MTTPVELPWTGAQRAAMRRKLLQWYRRAARPLPWRDTRNPYAIWVSEIMLQQTQVETVKPYFDRFLKAFPTIGHLAAADESRVLRLWEGLGYYRRARHLHAAARRIVTEHRGQFPRDRQDVLALPGIGRYTAGAVLSIAFDQPQPILEANTVRLLSRLSAMRGDVQQAANRAQLWHLAQRWLPNRGPGSGDVNQALMELGSLICRPKQPLCHQCPLREYCTAYRHGLVEQIPHPSKKRDFECRTEAAVVFYHRNRVLLRLCQPDERWAGLWDFPRTHLKTLCLPAKFRELTNSMSQLTGRSAQIGEQIAVMHHGVTRYRITLECYAGQFVDRRATIRRPWRWVKLAELPQYPLCVTGRKISRLIGGNGQPT